MRRQVRPNPTHDITENARQLDRVVASVLRKLIEEKSANAGFWKPVPEGAATNVALEMDLLRYFVGQWKRTEIGYDVFTVNIPVPSYLAFCYCAERANRAAGNTAIADAFAFIRSTTDAKAVVEERRSRGGLGRLIVSARLRLEDEPVYCLAEQLAMEKPADALVFARSEMWRGGAGDGWKQIVDPVVKKHTKEAARRGVYATRAQVDTGILAAGGTFEKPGEDLVFVGKKLMMARFVEEELRGVRGCDLRGVVANVIWNSQRLNGLRLDGAAIYGYITNCDLNDSVWNNAEISQFEFSFSNMNRSDFRGAKFFEVKFDSCGMRGISLQETDIADAGFMKCNMNGSDLRNAKCENVVFYGSSMRDSDIRGVKFTAGPDPFKANEYFRDSADRKLNDADLSGSMADKAPKGWVIRDGKLALA